MAMQAVVCSRPLVAQAQQTGRLSNPATTARFCLAFGTGCPVSSKVVGAQRTAQRKSLLTWRAGYSGSSNLSPEVKESVDKFLGANKVVLFMKGTKMFPQCGFSNTVIQILNSLNVSYETVNILEDDGLRQAMKEYSNWPTFPQLYIDGEFFGGCDIALEAYRSGELQELIEKVSLS